MSSPEREKILAARVPEDYLIRLDGLVKRGLFENRSGAIRQAILGLLNQRRTYENRSAERAVNRANEGDDISRSLEELFSLQRK